MLCRNSTSRLEDGREASLGLLLLCVAQRSSLSPPLPPHTESFSIKGPGMKRGLVAAGSTDRLGEITDGAGPAQVWRSHGPQRDSVPFGSRLVDIRQKHLWS